MCGGGGEGVGVGDKNLYSSLVVLAVIYILFSDHQPISGYFIPFLSCWVMLSSAA